MKTYEATEEGFFLGKFYAVGDRDRFHPRQIENDAHRWRLVDVKAAAVESAKAAAAAATPSPRRGRKGTED